MEIIIEHEDPNIRESVESDLYLFKLFSEKFDNVNINKIWIPDDFDTTVNQVLGISSYRSVRGINDGDIMTYAKILDTDDGTTIVLNINLFRIRDVSIRSSVYLHEISHLLIQTDLRPKTNPSYMEQIYLHNIGVSFEEYIADRMSYSFMQTLKVDGGEEWPSYLKSISEGFINNISNEEYYESMKLNIMDFRIKLIDVEEFLKRQTKFFDPVFISAVHLSAAMDYFPDELDDLPKIQSHFYNDNLRELLDYFMAKVQNPPHEFTDGIPIISKYMECFGFRFEEQSVGAYCHVLDI